MIRIETEVPEIIVEIEDREYPVAPRTVEVMDRLAEAERVNMGRPVYKLWLAQLEVLLGKDATRELFTAGRLENVDRIQKIYAGVARAFQYTDDAVTAATREKDLEAVATALAPLNEMLRHLRALEKTGDKPANSIREIHRG